MRSTVPQYRSATKTAEMEHSLAYARARFAGATFANPTHGTAEGPSHLAVLVAEQYCARSHLAVLVAEQYCALVAEQYCAEQYCAWKV